jgi:ketosteroid isomerase-like protein
MGEAAAEMGRLWMSMTQQDYAAYQGAAPYFGLVRAALGERVDGAHFFDVVADAVIYEVLYHFPGWPRRITGRAELMAMFRGYCQNIALTSADNLIVHDAHDGGTVVIEYEVHGTILASGVNYDNRFCSVIRLENRRIAHWRGYMDSLAAWNALTAGR